MFLKNIFGSIVVEPSSIGRSFEVFSKKFFENLVPSIQS